MLRILATGDLHIGRRPTRVPDLELAERASAARMWEAIVSRAIAQRVDAVLLSGDIVDHDNRFYEATGPLERGIRRLAEAGIESFAVAGNHDWDVFPRIVNQVKTPLFHFLGQGGNWEEAYLERDGQRQLRIIGWSFPRRCFQESPLRGFQLSPDPRLPTVGLLHADLDVQGSEYAPVRLAELQAAKLSLWVLGHIHKPQHWPSQAGAQVLYPGSPQALAPDEPGPHGPWLIEIDGPHSVKCRQFPMSLVRYQELSVDLAGAETSDEFETRVNTALTSALESAAGEEEPPRLLSLRLNFVGVTALCGRIDALARQVSDLERHRGQVQARIDQHTNLTQPAIDLEELSLRNDPTGALARTMLILERNEGDESVAQLIRDAASRLQEVHRASAYAALAGKDQPPEREAARKTLLLQGWQLLEKLRCQMPQPQEASA
jgi:DNA repair protein SbcD/Mre11